MNPTGHVGFFADGTFHRPLSFETLRWNALYVACYVALHGRLPRT